MESQRSGADFQRAALELWMPALKDDSFEKMRHIVHNREDQYGYYAYFNKGYTGSYFTKTFGKACLKYI